MPTTTHCLQDIFKYKNYISPLQLRQTSLSMCASDFRVFHSSWTVRLQHEQTAHNSRQHKQHHTRQTTRLFVLWCFRVQQNKQQRVVSILLRAYNAVPCMLMFIVRCVDAKPQDRGMQYSVFTSAATRCCPWQDGGEHVLLYDENKVVNQ